MVAKSIETKDKRLAFRVDSYTHELLEWILDKTETKKSDVFREALALWMTKKLSFTKDSDHRLTYISQDILKFVFDRLELRDIDQLIALDIKNQAEGLKYLNAINPESDNIRNFFSEIATLKGRLDFLRDLVYGPEGVVSLEKFEFQLEKSELIITIEHYVGENYGKYLIGMIEAHMQEFDYILLEINEKQNRISGSNELRFMFKKGSQQTK